MPVSRSWPVRPTVFIAITCCLMLGLQVWIEWRAYGSQVLETQASLVNLASSLAGHAEATIDLADAAVGSLVERLETEGTSPEFLMKIDRDLAAQVAAKPRYRSISVLDANGNWLATSMPVKGSGEHEREFFRHHLSDPDRGVFVGPPAKSRLMGDWIITVSRRFRSADGGFGGVVFASIRLSYFTDLFAKYDLGPNSSIGLASIDGLGLARYPSAQQFVGQDISQAAVFTKLRAQSSGSFENTGYVDGVRRFSGYRQCDRYPLVVVAAMSRDRALGEWRASASLDMTIGLGLSSVVGLLGLHLVRQMQRSRTAEDALRKSEEFLARSGRLAGVGGWEVDLGTDELSWTAETYRIHGVPPSYKPTLEEAIDFYAPEARSIVAAAIERCKADGTGWDLELPLNPADGRSIWVRAVGTVTFANGKPVRVAGTFQDITDRVVERQALQTASERAMLATEGGGIGIWDWNVRTNALIWDTWMYRLYGLQPCDDVAAYDLWQRHLHPDDREAAEQSLRSAIECSKPFDTEFRIVWDDGSVHHIRGCGRVTHDATGEVIRMVGANWDVTNQRIDEEQRATLVEAAPNGMMIVDESGMITLVNSQAEQIFDYPHGALVGQPVEILVPEGFRAAHRARRSGLTSGLSDRVMMTDRQFAGRRRDGGTVPIEILLRPVKTPRGALVVVSLFDVTERLRQAAEQHEIERRERLAIEANAASLDHLSRHLAAARDRAEQANRAKTRFLAGMSHELRTPLNGILGYAQLLHMEGDLNPRQVARVDAMLAAGKHLLQMITCVLDLSEIEAEHVKLQAIEFDVRAVAEACVDLIRPAADAKGLALTVAVTPGARLTLISDPTRLRQILLNLLGNAAKFTSQGAIGLCLKPWAGGGALRIEVWDTGTGIPHAQRQRLFQDFERLDTEATRTVEGAGLGLALSARLAALMGARLGHDDNPGGGSVFWLELPLNTQALANQAPAPAANGLDGQADPPPDPSMHVLVVDDVAMNRDIAGSFLRRAGYRVSFAASGAEAVSAVANGAFDVVLMDVRMPGMDGLEATRRIRSQESSRKRLPIVALTAQAFTDQVEACHKAGMDSHLAKPFDMDALLAAVAQAVASRQPSDAGADAVSTPDVQPLVLDQKAFERCAAFFTSDALARYLRTIADMGESLLTALRQPDGLMDSGDKLAEAAHSLAGTAGMLGFERVNVIGRRFEQAVLSGAQDASSLASELYSATEATCLEIYHRIQ